MPAFLQDKLRAIGKKATEQHPSHRMPSSVLDKLADVLPWKRDTIKGYCKPQSEEEQNAEKSKKQEETTEKSSKKKNDKEKEKDTDKNKKEDKKETTAKSKDEKVEKPKGRLESSSSPKRERNEEKV